MNAREVMQQSVRRWAVDEAKAIESAEWPRTRITAVDVYLARNVGGTEIGHADGFAQRQVADQHLRTERRWQHVEDVCAQYGVKL